MKNPDYSIRTISALPLLMFAHSALATFDEKPGTDPVHLNEITVVAEVKADKVYELKQSGRIMPLEDLISQVRSEYPGRIIEVELDDDDGRYVYELELVDENGVVWDLEVDASTGQVLKYEQDDQTE